jgi:hypothetical protein
LTDLFVVGLALDIVGAGLLAKGLLVSPRTIAELSGQAWDFNVMDAIDRVHNRIDAEFGAIALAGGFTFQAIGYVALLLGVDSATGGVETLVAVALALSAGVGVLLVWRRVRPRRTLALLPSVTLAIGKDDPGQWTPFRAGMLRECGRRLGHPPRDGEGRNAYTRRVFGLELPPEEE